MRGLIQRGCRFALAALLGAACMCPATAMAADLAPAQGLAESLVDDTPVPFGVKIVSALDSESGESTLVAVISAELSGATFDFVWEKSSDDGKTWQTIGTSQSLKMTNDIYGNLVRVTVNSDLADETTGKTYSATSALIEVKKAKGPIAIADKEQTITAEKSIIKVVGCKAFKVKAIASGGGKLTFASSNTKVATVNKTTGKVTVKKAGAAKITVTAASNGSYAPAKKVVTLKVLKRNTLSAKGKTVEVKAGKATTVRMAKAFKVKNVKGTVTFKKVSGSKKITVTKNGVVKVKAGLKANKTYTVKVKVQASGDKLHASMSATVTLKVKVTK